MKQLITLTFFLLTFTAFAQKPCEYSANVTDSIGTYKITNECLISEKNFGNTFNYVFFALAQTDGLPTLNLQLIQKSKDFIKANCFDKNSRVFLQLQNGKVVTLMHVDQENCGTLIRDDKGYDNRVNTGIFMFLKDNFEELKKSPINIMRIKYLTSTEDYIVKNELKSEMNGKVYKPDTYLMENIRCVE
ncbi:hypothetical protein [Flavobacterium saccharophilum]|uniref:Tissue inhibitor of metalloproteinase n=1 Tax=Flavobacterium saccharophilum TaxID=29534 RepID=A0A1M7FIT5_9FLAO|nr:hypothetical protein [Flavobacterium saccharophilum]SHM03698.1 hypothetical protein SAMN05444366_2135 [Flavobacterium saccharophilum]